MSNKILVITGLTATGKTSLGVEICKKIDGEIISADSRQVYKYMDIGTGKDKGSAKFNLVNKIDNMDVGFYKIKGVPVWLLDVVEPTYQFSVSNFVKLASGVIDDIKARGKKVVLVGGDGYYIRSLQSPPETLVVKPKQWLRKILNKLGIKTITFIYMMLDNKNYLALNNSERSNRHRLIRKIEIKLTKVIPKPYVNNLYDFKVICLFAPRDRLKKNIVTRVEKRLMQGLLTEVEFLKNRYGWDSPGLNCLAYKEFRPYFETKMNFKECVEKWINDETRYAKRQTTWFKNTNYQMVNIEHLNKRKMLKEIEKWYNN